MFQKASFNARSIHADTPPRERGDILQDWNTETSKFDILVISTSIYTAALEMHRCCHWGIGFGLTWNVATILHFIKHLFRMGQQSKVTWILPYLKNTICEWQQDHMLRKVRPTPLNLRLGAPNVSAITHTMLISNQNS